MSDEPHGILDKTLGEILQSNPQAQNIVMKAMKISPEQLQQMIQSTTDNQLMNMTIRDMFKNGIMQQAAAGHFSNQTIQQGQPVQVTPEQMQHLTDAIQNGQKSTAQPQKQSFLQKIRGLFK